MIYVDRVIQLVHGCSPLAALFLGPRLAMRFSHHAAHSLCDAVRAMASAVAPTTSDTEWRRLARSLPDILLTADRDGTIRFINRTVPGLTPEAVVGRSLWEFTAPDHREQVRLHLEKTFDTTEPTRFEATGHGAHGTSAWYACRSSPLLRDGKVVAAVMLFTDITHRKQAEEAMRAFVEGTGAATGDEFFRSLVRHLAEALDVRVAFVAEIVDEERARARTLALWREGSHRDNIEYSLAGTPCERTVAGQLCLYPDHVQRLFPDDPWLVEVGARSYLGIPFVSSTGEVVGHMGIMDDRPMEDEHQRRSIVEILAGRAGAELERTRTEQALRNSERRFRSVVETAVSVILSLSSEGRILEFNPEAERLHGWRRDDVLGRDYVTLFLPKSAHHRARATIADVLAGNVARNLEYPIRTPSGTERILAWNVSRLDAAGDGAPQAIIAVGQDVTDQKQADEALRQSEQRFRKIFEEGPLGMAIVGLDHRLVTVNEQLCRMLGYTHDDLLCLSFQDVMHRADAEKNTRRTGQAFSGEVSSYQTDTRFVRKDQSLLEVSLTATVIRNDEGKPLYGLAMIEDITARKRAEADLRAARDQALEAVRAKSVFLAAVSHELRTPMQGIIGATNLLLSSGLTEEQREYASLTESCAQTQLAVVNDLLDFSAIEARKVTLTPRPNDLHRTVNEVVMLLANDAKKKGLQLSAHYDDGVPRYVVIDRGRVQQVLMNLVGNAIKFTAHGSVRIHVGGQVDTAGEAQLRIVVADTGIGIPQNKLSVIFDRFTQVDVSTTRRHGGTGLGLSICKELVQLMGGRIGAESQPGRGTRFWFTLETPIAAAPADAPRAAHVPESRETAAARVLVAEDNLLSQKVTARMLEQLGCQVDVADTGAAAVEMVTRGSYDLVLMDCLMPEMDGIDATAAIRQAEGDRRHVPIICVTALAAAGDRNRCLASGMDDFLTKPISAKDLESLLGRWCCAPGSACSRECP